MIRIGIHVKYLQKKTVEYKSNADFILVNVLTFWIAAYSTRTIVKNHHIDVFLMA